MIEPLDLKTVLLVFGDFGEYATNRTKGSHIILSDENLYLSKEKFVHKHSETISDGMKSLRLFQFLKTKVYMICTSVDVNETIMSNTLPVEVFYSDSQLDAKERFTMILNEFREKKRS